MRWYGSSAIMDEIITKNSISAFNHPGLFETDFPSYPWLMIALYIYKSIFQLPNHVVILMKTAGLFASLFNHYLWVFSVRHLRWLSCKSQVSRADEIATSWVDYNVGLQGPFSPPLSLSLFLSEFDNLLFLHMWVFTRRCLSKRKAGKNKSMWPLFSLFEIAKWVCSGTMPPVKIIFESVEYSICWLFINHNVFFFLLPFAFPTRPLFQPGAFFHLGRARYS